jgi:hypothetical protein
LSARRSPDDDDHAEQRTGTIARAWLVARVSQPGLPDSRWHRRARVIARAGVGRLVRAGQVRILGALRGTALARIDRPGQLVGVAGRGLDGLGVADHLDRAERLRLESVPNWS